MLAPFYLPFENTLESGPGGIDIRTLIKSEATNGQFSSTETAANPKLMGPPPHSHKDLDEIIYVTEGICTIWIDGHIQEVRAKEWFFMPKNSIHTFFNNENQTLRFIGMYFHQNFEDYLEELFHDIVPSMVAQNLSPMHPDIIVRMNDLNDRFGVVMYPEKRQAIVDEYDLIG